MNSHRKYQQDEHSETPESSNKGAIQQMVGYLDIFNKVLAVVMAAVVLGIYNGVQSLTVDAAETRALIVALSDRLQKLEAMQDTNLTFRQATLKQLSEHEVSIKELQRRVDRMEVGK